MKPTDLKWPSTWEERKPWVHQRVLFVPNYYDRHGEWASPGWEDPSLFNRPGDLHIEYCSGNGAWVLEKARQNPHQNWVAVEKKFNRVRQLWAKMHNRNVTNLIIVLGEALTFTHYYLAPETVAAAYVNFPDPWPKDKHAKHRLFQEPFSRELHRVLKKDSPLTIVTDDNAYCAQILTVMRPLWNTPAHTHDTPGYGTSYFDSLWREKGRLIHYLGYTR